MDWKNFLIAAAGIVAAPYTGGASLQFTAGAIANHANKSAQDQLTKAGAQAQTTTTQVRDQNLARLDPWVQTGSSANSTLRDLFGLAPVQPTAGGTAETAQDPSADPTMTGMSMKDLVSGLSPNGPNQGMTLKDRVAAVQAPNVAQQKTQSSYVRMRAPNGEEEDVDPKMVPHYQQLGAQLIGAA